MNRYSVLVSHLVKLVDTHDTPVGEYHRAPLEVELALQKGRKGTISTAGSTNPITIGLTVLTSRCTEAVRPAAEDPFPEV